MCRVAVQVNRHCAAHDASFGLYVDTTRDAFSAKQATDTLNEEIRPQVKPVRVLKGS